MTTTLSARTLVDLPKHLSYQYSLYILFYLDRMAAYTCGVQGCNRAGRRCTGCHIVAYCDTNHKREDFNSHKIYCRSAEANYNLMQTQPLNGREFIGFCSVLVWKLIFEIQQWFKFWNWVSNVFAYSCIQNLTLLNDNSALCWNKCLMICGCLLTTVATVVATIIFHKCWY